jgi:hypothetical protein
MTHNAAFSMEVRTMAIPSTIAAPEDTSSRTDPRCRPLTDPLAPDARPWQRRQTTQILAALAGLLPMAGLSIWMYLLQDRSMTVDEMLLGPLVGGGTLIFWILFLHVFVSGDRLDGFGFRAPRILLDLGLGSVLAVALLAFHLVFNATIAPWFPPKPPAEEVIELIAGLSRDPLYLALWLGPVVWIGVAGFEELMRAFVLRRSWRVWSGGGPVDRDPVRGTGIVLHGHGAHPGAHRRTRALRLDPDRTRGGRDPTGGALMTSPVRRGRR